ncbi:rust resistance kinase Lr10 isoform X1 [Ziziphus jujuba]|uniref:Rust resistance kinase Lr10 isoform X1 n=1 Tax=Ziziphus jujuba TaxID=326968 RepID=A0A6P3ZSJ3_ZIZJJ|nr:rust resistance kinase Lr10 isoform X1 [Ziziphus jujuba]
MNIFMGVPTFQNLLFIFFFFLFTISGKTDGAGPAGPDDECKPIRCKHNGPVIRFPFRLRDRQPTHCGYPGFELSCTADKENSTVLELPRSVKLLVKNINYKNQQIQVYDPNMCFLRQILNLNISASPFQFPFIYELESFIIFNCSSGYDYYYGLISCLSNHDYKIIAKPYKTETSYWELSSCKKMLDIPSVPDFIIYDYNQNIPTSLEWSKPMCAKCEAQGMECVLDRNSSLATQTKCLYIPKHSTSAGKSRKLVITGIILCSFLLVLVGIGIYRLHSTNKIEKENRQKIEKFLQDYRDLKPTRYSYADIKRITNQFKEKLGQGGYGTVFKGRISNDVIVAVKILNNFKGHGDEFINEVGSMGTIHHVNVARLVGFCADGEQRALVYEFLSNGSLEKYIFSADGLGQRQSHSLGYDKLQDIALGIAKGIDYLHQGCDQRIIHLDIKPHNVLLDQNFIPKISDFGTAKLCSKEQSAVSMTAARGTMGYIAPEVLSRNFGNVSHKSDVYSFGMLLLEIVGGRKNIDVNVDNTSQVYYPEWVYKHLNKEEDPGMGIVEEGQFKIIKKLIIVGLWCIQWYPVNRPSMNKVVRMLEGDENDLVMPPNPFASADSSKRSSTALKRPMHSALEIISESD